MITPMHKKLQELVPTGEIKSGPSAQVINALLNFSKSLEVKKIKNSKTLIHLN